MSKDKIKVKKGGLLYLIRIAYRNIFRNMRRSILSIIAVSMAVFLISFMMSYIEGMLSSAAKIAQTYESGHIKLMTKEFEEKEAFMPLQYPIENAGKMIEDIKSIEGVKVVTPRIISYATFTNSKVKHGIVSGVDFENIINNAKDKKNKNKYAYYNFTKKTNGLITGRYPASNKNECAIGYRLAKKMEIVPPIVEKNEFDWILVNIEDENSRNTMKEAYKYIENKSIYKLTLFQSNDWEHTNGENKLTKEELKKNDKDSKEKYIKLLEVLINLNIKDIPTTIGKDSTIADYIFQRDYQKDYFLQAYRSSKDVYYLKRGVDSFTTDLLLKYFTKAIMLRIPFKIISSQYSDKYYQPKLVGIYDFDYVVVDANYILIPIKKMQRLASLPDQTQNIFVFVDNLKDSPIIAEKIAKKINDPNIIIKDWTTSPFIAMFRQAEYIYGIMYAVFIIVASFLIINTVIMVIHERIKEIGMMGALGMVRSEIVMVFFFEAIVLSLLGSFGGTLLAGILTSITTNMPISIESLTGGVDFPVSNTIFIIFSPTVLLKGFLFGTILTSLCTLFPSLKSAFIEPVEALRR